MAVAYSTVLSNIEKNWSLEYDSVGESLGYENIDKGSLAHISTTLFVVNIENNYHWRERKLLNAQNSLTC